MRTLFGVILGVIGGLVAYTTIVPAVNNAVAAVSAAVTIMPMP